MTITINDKPHTIPQSWAEFPFSKLDDLIFADDPLFVLTGIPTVMAEHLDDAIKAVLIECVAVFGKMPSGTAEPIDINDQPFQQYVNASYAVKANDKLAFVRAYYPDAADNCQDCLPLYNALSKAWADFHRYWSWLETKPDPDWVGAGIKRMDKYGVYGMVAQLGNRSLELEAYSVNLPTKHVFTHRAYWSEMDEVISAYQQIKNKPRK